MFSCLDTDTLCHLINISQAYESSKLNEAQLLRLRSIIKKSTNAIFSDGILHEIAAKGPKGSDDLSYDRIYSILKVLQDHDNFHTENCYSYHLKLIFSEALKNDDAGMLNVMVRLGLKPSDLAFEYVLQNNKAKALEFLIPYSSEYIEDHADHLLHDTVSAGYDAAVIKVLLQKVYHNSYFSGYSPNMLYEGQTPLELAVKTNNSEAVNELVKGGVKACKNEFLKFGDRLIKKDCLLHSLMNDREYHAKQNKAEESKILKQGDQYEYPKVHGLEALLDSTNIKSENCYFANQNSNFYKSLLWYAIENQNVAYVNSLIKSNTSISIRKICLLKFTKLADDSNEHSNLYKYAHFDHYPVNFAYTKYDENKSEVAFKILELLVEESSKHKSIDTEYKHIFDDIAAPNKYSSLIHFATEDGNDRVVELLLKHGSSTAIKDWEGKTPLHIASESKNYDIATLLLENGADTQIVDNEGHIPADYLEDGITFEDIVQQYTQQGSFWDAPGEWVLGAYETLV